MRARLLTAQSLVHVNGQPLLRQPVTRWISPVARQAHLLRRQARPGAHVDNAPSLVVSRRLGYVENGVSLTDSLSGVVELQHLRLTRESWAAHPVDVTGLDACLAWFGVSD